jgi:hypothetical protein
VLVADDRDRDPARLVLLGLGDVEFEDAAVEARSDALGVDAPGTVSDRANDPQPRSSRW